MSQVMPLYRTAKRTCPFCSRPIVLGLSGVTEGVLVLEPAPKSEPMVPHRCELQASAA